MAIKDFLAKIKSKMNNKKNICIALALLICISSVVGWRFANRTNASVYIKDEYGDSKLVDHINVLEIVAREGQQVLGYTVDGQQPITADDINNYGSTTGGTMNLSDADMEDFHAVTGYKINKIPMGGDLYKYKVIDNDLKDTFNNNVLSQQMDAGQIVVKAVQASDLKVSDVDWADLIYINSNDYNDHLLYYYDQFKYGGALGIKPDDPGEGFNGVFSQVSDKKLKAIAKIVDSVGYIDKAEEITQSDFDFLKSIYANATDEVNLNNYLACNHSAYINALAAMDENDGFSDDIDEAIKEINAFLAEVNESERAAAVAKILAIADSTDPTPFPTTDEGRRDLIGLFQKAQLSGYRTVNDEAYVTYLATEFTLFVTEFDITGGYTTESLLDKANVKELTNAIAKLVKYKNIANSAIEAGGGTGEVGEVEDPENPNSKDSFGLTLNDYADINIQMQKADIGTIYSKYSFDYYKEFVSSDFTFTGTAEDMLALREKISDVNNLHRQEALEKFASLPTDPAKIEAFETTAVDDFAAMDLKGYNSYYINNYINNIKLLSDANAFRTGTDYDEAKMVAFIADVNNEEVYETAVSLGDISWKTAMAIYNNVSTEKTALIYNTDLMTSNDVRNCIGNYSEELSDKISLNVDMKETGHRELDNTNNMYKMLLLLRQIQYSYYNSDLAAKIDAFGNYYPNGIESGDEPVASWNKATFGTDYTNYAKYHEPDVVGQTYDESGTAGASSNYIYKRIYCYSGSQFFGGSMFVVGSDIGSANYVITKARYTKSSDNKVVTSSDLLEGDNFVLVSTTAAPDFNNYDRLYVHEWDNSDNGTPSALVASNEGITVGSVNYYYRFPLDASKNYTNFLLKTKSDWSGSKTADCTPGKSYGKTSSEIIGKLYNLSGYSLSEAPSSAKYAIAGITNSINNGIVEYSGKMSMRFWSYSSADYDVKARYTLYVNGTPVYSGNDGGVHRSENYADGSNQPFKLNDEINIIDSTHVQVGDDTIELKDLSGNTLTLNTGSILSINLQYDLGAYTVTRNYSYKKIEEEYKISITNFYDSGIVDFAGGVDMRFAYEGDISNVQYSYKGSGYTAVSNGSVLVFGEELKDGDMALLNVKFTANGTEYTTSTTIRKVSFEREKNYISLFTETNVSSLPYNELLSSTDNDTIMSANKGGIIRYLLRVSLTEVNYPVKVLEIQPAASVTAYSGFDGAKKFAEYLNINWKADGMNSTNYSDYINIQTMSIKEFNTRNDDLTATYDVIYFGKDSGYQLTYKSTGRTSYLDTSMNGLVYTGIGDEYNVLPFLRGAAAADYNYNTGWAGVSTAIDYGADAGTTSSHWQTYEYWKMYFTDGFRGNTNPSWNLPYDPMTTGANGSSTTGNYYTVKNTNTITRLSGNDLTVMRMNDLLDYVKAGYPILMEDEILNCDSDYWIDYDNNVSNASRWRYVDKYSKMYNFILQAKQLGKDASGNYTDSSQFLDGRTYASLVAVSTAATGGNPDYEVPANKFNGGLSYAYRRVAKPNFKYVSGPLEYGKYASGEEIPKGNIGSIIPTTSSDYTRFNMVVKINNNGGVDKKELDGQYEYTVYMDKSGVGKYEDDVTIDMDCDVEYVFNEKERVSQINLSCQLPQGLEGFVPWKLVISNKKNPEQKYVYSTYSAFASKEGVRDVYVLWVYPQSGLTLDFKKMIEANATPVYNAGYNIHTICMTYKKFNSLFNNDPCSGNRELAKSKYGIDLGTGTGSERVPKTLNDFRNEVNLQFDEDSSLLKVKYLFDNRDYASTNMTSTAGIDKNLSIDMIVVGFSDSHAEMDFCNMAALKNMQYLLDSGHTMLYSHDNSGYYSSINWYIDDGTAKTSGTSACWGRYSTSFFRQTLGMDQYGLMTGGSLDDLPIEYANARLYVNPSKANEESFRGLTENLTFHYTTGKKDQQYSNSLHGTSANNYGDWSHTNMVMKVNRGQITEYPFLLKEYMPTTVTHSQYNTVSLEDPDLTVWYTLDVADNSRSHGNNSQLYQFTKGDGANNYYIYSKGNITYTGSGHTSGQTIEEQQLFINTVIAALKVGNFPPTVTMKNGVEEGGTYYYNYYTGSTGVNVTFNPLDYDYKDGQLAFSNLKIYVDMDGVAGYNDANDILLNDNALLTSLVSDTSGNAIILDHSDLLNRQDRTFRFTTANLNSINARIAAKAPGKTIYDYEIVIEVSDHGLRKAKNPIPAKGSASFKLKETSTPEIKYFDLN